MEPIPSVKIQNPAESLERRESSFLYQQIYGISPPARLIFVRHNTCCVQVLTLLFTLRAASSHHRSVGFGTHSSSPEVNRASVYGLTGPRQSKHVILR